MSVDTVGRIGTPSAEALEHSAWLGWIPAAPTPDLVAVSHGTDDPEGRKAVLGLVAAVDLALADVTVHGSFVDVQHPRVADLLASGTIGHGRTAALVPLLLSAGTHATGDLGAAADTRVGISVADPLGPHPSLAAVLHRRLLQAGWVPGEAVILACAGTRDPAGLADCRTMAQLLAGRLQVPVTPAYISAAEPRLAEALGDARTRNPGARTVVASYLLAPGYFAQLAAGCVPEVLGAPLLDPAAAPPRELVDIVVERYRRAISR